jgi:MoxR-like ATPase
MARTRSSEPSGVAALLPALQRLDERLARAVAAAEVRLGVAPGEDLFRGLYLTSTDSVRLLADDPLSAGLDAAPPAADVLNDPALGPLGTALGLEPFDLEVVLIAAAPKLDLRYGRVYAYLQDDVTCHRPSVDLALGLLCQSAAERVDCARRLRADAPLLRQRVVCLRDEDGDWLTRSLDLEGGILRRLLGEAALDSRLSASCELLGSPHAPQHQLLPESVRDAVSGALAGDRPLRLTIGGPPGCGQLEIAAEVAAALGRPLLVCRLVNASDPRETAILALREARLADAVAYLAGVTEPIADMAADHPGPLLVTGAGLSGGPKVEVTAPDRSMRRRCWATELGRAKVRVGSEELDALADRFPLSFDEIRSLIRDAERHGTPTAAGLFARGRAYAGEALADHARQVVPAFEWSDVVLPAETRRQLRELCDRVAQRQRVLDEWGFAQKLARTPGVTALFAGPSGTGKTMVAEVIAGELGLDLYAIDLSAVVSKYIGETEKNLRRVFDAAGGAGAVLFFDEADALFGKRSEVRDSHDRYANIEVAFLLQEMERHPGIAILATNLVELLDDAFARRLAFRIRFGPPDEHERRLMWEKVWPTAAPRDGDLDLPGLARDYELTGGGIRNAALAAAFLAATEGQPIGREHVLKAVRREFAKLGSVPPGRPALEPVGAMG